MSDKISEYKFVISTLIFEYCFYEIAIESLRIRAGAEGIAYHQNVRKIRKICMIALLGPIKHVDCYWALVYLSLSLSLFVYVITLQ